MTLAPIHTSKASRTAVALVTLVAAASLLAACGGEKKKGPTQVAAKVNKEEISVHQINFVLQRTPGLKPEQVPAASKRVLEGLIDQELAVQQASEQKLDRDPNVVMAIEGAKREILARAYADKIASTAVKPSDPEVADYYAKHPGLFSQRRIYALQEIGVEANAAQKAELQTKLQGITTPAQATAALTAANVKFATRELTQSPENLPLPIADKLAGVNVGQFLVNPTPNGFSLIFVTSAKPAAVTPEQAKPAIESFLMNDRKRTLVADNMKHLRQEAKIEYLGQFTAGPAEAASSPPAPAPTAPAASGLDANALQKGLSGLK